MAPDFQYSIKFEDKSVQFFRELDKRSKLVGNKAGSIAVKQAKDLCAVDGGKLRKSIRKKVTLKNNWLWIIVGSTNKRAHWLELGTENMRAQPFIGPIAQPLIKNFIDLLVKEANRIKV